MFSIVHIKHKDIVSNATTPTKRTEQTKSSFLTETVYGKWHRNPSIQMKKNKSDESKGVNSTTSQVPEEKKGMTLV